MAVLKPRTRLVSFRLSDEEYEKLQGACIAEGARSISEFARLALQRSVHSQHDGGGLEVHKSFSSGTKELIDTMRELNRQLGRLVSLRSADGRE